MSLRKRLAREPLVHFLILGALLFALDAWLRPASQDRNPEIVVNEARVRNLAQTFHRTWQRPPTREELQGLVESHVREEVMVREALALGLDRDDAIVRRRLQQKMDFVAEEAAAATPTDDDLAKYLGAHADAFRVDPTVTFAQVYLDPRKRGAALDADAKRMLDQLNRTGGAVDPSKLGDALMLLEPRYANAPQGEVARLFGAEFADALVKQPVGKWTGPIASGYGVHLVKVESIAGGGTPALADVRPLVEREWANARRKATSQAFYEKLRAKYRIVVKMSEAATP
jgi:parvulin-like peptidyl-prolyl isomerase